TIRRERHGTERTGMPLERFKQCSGGDVPQLEVSATTGRGQGLAAGRKGRVIEKPPSGLAITFSASIWILDRLHRFPGLGRPDDRRPVAAAAGQQRSVPRKVEGNTVARVSVQAVDQSARGDLPDLQWTGRAL